MIGQSARLYACGGWGKPNPPAFAYDLTKGALYKQATCSGLQRYGKKPGSGDDDTRPLGQSYDIEWLSGIVGTELSPLVDGSRLTPLPSVFGSLEGFSHGSTVANNPVSFRSAFNIAKNGGWSIWAYLHPWPKAQVVRLHQWFWGTPGAGFVFQIRGESAEIAGLSLQYNEGDMSTLRLLWGLQSPTDDDRVQIETLQNRLFVDFESLSFERSTGRGKWIDEEWKLSFIAEPRGVLHIVAEGLDATGHEVSAILKTRQAGVLWEDSPLTLWHGGGAFFFSIGQPLFRSQSSMSFGPFKTAYFADSLGALTYAYNVYTADNQSVVMSKTDIDEIHFGLGIAVTNGNTNSTPWIYGAASRLAPGPNDGSTAIAFDTDNLYTPATPANERDPGQVILEIEQSFADMNRRTCKILMRDIHGMTSNPMGSQSLANRVATLELGGVPLLSSGIISVLDESDMASLAANLPIQVKRFESDLGVTLSDSWAVVDEMDFDSSSPIGDNLPFGTYLKQLLSCAGLSPARLAGIPDGGRRVARAALGEDWASRVDGDTKIGDAVRAVMESYGYGYRLYEDNLGVWQLAKPSMVALADFSSNRVPTPLTDLGRQTILTPIDITHDSSNFFNHIVVYGGEKGDQVFSEWIDWPSINDPTSPKYIGRRKTKKVRNTSLRTQNDAGFAARSAWWLYGRGGRRAQYASYNHESLLIGQRIQCDGGIWEVDGCANSSWAKDEAIYSVREILAGDF